MELTILVDDRELFDVSKTVKVEFLLDKAYKQAKEDLLPQIYHTRRQMSAFDMWFNHLPVELQMHVDKSIHSTIDPEEIVPKDNKSRDLIIEAIKHYRNTQENDSRANDEAVSAEELH